METYLNKLKALLGIPSDDTSKDLQLSFALTFVTDAIKSYCNITDIPADLESVVLQMAEDYYRSKYPEEFPQAQAVQSVKRGDVTTTFGAAKASVKAGPGAAFVQNYAAQLNAFRKLRW